MNNQNAIESAKPLVLIVDDDPSNRSMLGGILGNENYDIANAESGEKALAFVNKRRPHLILLDVVMPEMNGYAVCKKLKENESTAGIPIIFITGEATKNEEVLKGFNAGGVDYITKPIKKEILLARARTHTTLRKRELELVRTKEELLLANQELLKINQNISSTHKEVTVTLSDVLATYSYETAGHVARVGEIAFKLAEKANLSDDDKWLIKNTAPMHDIGKIGIPQIILNKPGRLNDAEFKIMKYHPTIGYELLKKTKSDFLKKAATIVYQHHERWDGAGYPNGLSGKDIDKLAQIVAIADSFDAATHKRCYQDEKAIDVVLKDFESQRGKQFAPEFIDLFLANKEIFIDIVKENGNSKVIS